MNANQILHKLDNVATNGDLSSDMRRVHQQAATRLRAALEQGRKPLSSGMTPHGHQKNYAVDDREQRIADALDHAQMVLDSWS